MGPEIRFLQGVGVSFRFRYSDYPLALARDGLPRPTTWEGGVAFRGYFGDRDSRTRLTFGLSIGLGYVSGCFRGDTCGQVSARIGPELGFTRRIGTRIELVVALDLLAQSGGFGYEGIAVMPSLLIGVNL